MRLVVASVLIAAVLGITHAHYPTDPYPKDPYPKDPYPSVPQGPVGPKIPGGIGGPQIPEGPKGPVGPGGQGGPGAVRRTFRPGRNPFLPNIHVIVNTNQRMHNNNNNAGRRGSPGLPFPFDGPGNVAFFGTGPGQVYRPRPHFTQPKIFG